MNYPDYYTLTGDPSPLLLTAIHDGHAVRDELRSRFQLSDVERRYEEDPHTASWARLRKPHLIGLHSRFEVDLNRPRDKAVYLKPADAWGLTVWAEPPTEAMVRRSLRVYDRFYEALESFLERSIEEYGSVVVYDIHSYNHRRDDQDRQPADPAANPVVNIGTGNVNRDRWATVIDTFIDTMRQTEWKGRPLDVRENVKFRGGNLNHWAHERFGDACCVLSIEFKKVFMDEHTNTLFAETLQTFHRALAATFDPVLRHRQETVPATRGVASS